jgi:hypothetical protein
MIINQINNDGRTKLLMSLTKLTNSFSKRGTAIVIIAHSEYVGEVILIVTGKKGTVQKSIVVVYNHKTEYWEGYNDGYMFEMNSLSEISSLIKSKISGLYTVLSKV